jgi:rSAM/selenodomain-associated transferase 1
MAVKTDCMVAVFAKAPRAGEVKTRLIPALGAEGAATLHSRLLRHTVDMVIESGLQPRELWCSPDTSDSTLQQYAARAGAKLQPQSSGDLGQRMEWAFASLLERSRRAILIGCDCPCLGAQDLRAAAAALEVDDAVFVPAEDGGYCLIGLRRFDASLFRDIVWSGPDVMQSTRTRVAALGWRGHELSLRWDVDRPEDVERLRQHPRLAPLLEGLSVVPPAAR